MQTLNLKQLEAFCAVVERGSFTAAADALYLAQSTVSGHILALEKDIGVPLLVRSGNRRITLTEEGRRVYDHAHTILPVSYTHLDVYKRQPLHSCSA